jgi:hypothetical protein
MSIYLYIKQCKHCGLKYFGKTINKNVSRYFGSGHYWKRHINLHGRENVVTIRVWEFDDQSAATDFALQFSKDYNIVGSKNWANIIPEDGNNGNSSAVITDDLRNKFKKANAGQNNPMYGTIWITNGLENKKIKKDIEIPPGWKKGRFFNEEMQRTFVSRSKIGKNNPRYDPTLYCFHNTKSGEKVTKSCWDFCAEYNLKRKPIREMVKGKRLEYQEWKLF